MWRGNEVMIGIVMMAVIAPPVIAACNNVIAATTRALGSITTLDLSGAITLPVQCNPVLPDDTQWREATNAPYITQHVVCAIYHSNCASMVRTVDQISVNGSQL